MVTRQQVLMLVESDYDYPWAAEKLGIPPGQAYMVATGLPADGGDTLAPYDRDRPGVIEGSTQHLVHRKPEPANPTQKSQVREWIRRRAQADTQMFAAARERDAAPAEPERPEETDIRYVLTRQHDQVTALMEQLKAIPGVTKGGSEKHQSRRESIIDMMTVSLSKHATAEQEHLWPRVRDVLANGDEVVEAALEQEQQGKDGLTALDKAGDKLGDRPAERRERAEEEPGPGGMPEPGDTSEE